MKRSRFNEEQIIAILQEQEAGAKTADVCRKHGISGATFYKWKAKYGGLDVSDARALISAGAWTSCRMHSPMAGGSASWRSSMTSRGNAWRWWPTRRYPGC